MLLLENLSLKSIMGSPGGISGKEPNCQCRRCEFNPWVRKIPQRHGNPLQYACLENPMDRGVTVDWQATIHRVTNSHMRQK